MPKKLLQKVRRFLIRRLLLLRERVITVCTKKDERKRRNVSFLPVVCMLKGPTDAVR